MTQFFYYRCSTDAQDATRQQKAAIEAGVLPENIYGDHITGVSDFSERPELTRCLETISVNPLG